MGTSSAFDGPGNGTPLVPTWLEPDGQPLPLPNNEPAPNNDNIVLQDDTTAELDNLSPVLILPNASRFTAARDNFSRFVRSGGNDRGRLGRAVAHYVSTSSGGARQAARRMGPARTSGAKLLGFMSNAVLQGAREALRTLNLEGLAGRPIEEVFLGLIEYICPTGGTIDEGIARDAFLETIADLAWQGITDLDTLTLNQMQTVFELYATHAIEARLYNDIGAKVIVLAADVRLAQNIQAQIHDFIRRGVADALTTVHDALQSLTEQTVQRVVSQVYEQAFIILQSLGNMEARAA